MQTLVFYTLAAFKRNSFFSVESGLKYFISGSFISGLFLMGISILYIALGTLNFYYFDLLFTIPFAFFSSTYLFFLDFGIILIVVTFLFKLGCAPFHFWSPDVYEGAPLSSTIIFSLIPKISLFFVFSKIIFFCHDVFFFIKETLLFFGLVSVLMGTFFALSQTRVKRFVLYSSIAQTGFVIIALGISNHDSFFSMYFFLLIYLITSFLI